MPPPVHMRPGMHTPSYEGTPPVVDATPSTHASWYAHPPVMKVHPLQWMQHWWMPPPSYEGTPPVVDATPVHMHPGMHTPSYEGTPPVVDAALVDATPQL